MDISLTKTQQGNSINVESIHGILWLQTHFPSEFWKALAQNKALIPDKDVKLLIEDATQAGISVNLVLSHTKLKKF